MIIARRFKIARRVANHQYMIIGIPSVRARRICSDCAHFLSGDDPHMVMDRMLLPFAYESLNRCL